MRAAHAVSERVPLWRRALAERQVPVWTTVLAFSIPWLFLEFEYQPDAAFQLGSTRVDAYLSDWTLLAVVVAAAVRGRREGFGVLARGRVLWTFGALFFVWVLFGLVHGRLHSSAYELQTHAVTAAKFGEYALLAPATVLLIRRRDELQLVLWTLVGWSCLATLAGFAQFAGADIFAGGAAGHRQASFLSSGDFAALSVAAFLVGLVALALPRLMLGRRLAATAIATGAVGSILAGSLASVLGLVTASVVLAALVVAQRGFDPRRAAAVAGALAVVLGGAIAIRSTDLEAFSHFLGASSTDTKRAAKIQTYAHRTLLSWLGFEIWKGHPLIGVGWEASAEPATFEPYLPAAHKRFPTESPLAFPSATRRYGVQDAWIQSLADLGVVGFVLWTGVFAAAGVLAITGVRRARSPGATVALLWIALLAWLWTAEGFVAGIPLDALTWLAFGLAAATAGAAAETPEAGAA
jgi:O-antigen ligase